MLALDGRFAVAACKPQTLTSHHNDEHHQSGFLITKTRSSARVGRPRARALFLPKKTSEAHRWPRPGPSELAPSELTINNDDIDDLGQLARARN